MESLDHIGPASCYQSDATCSPWLLWYKKVKSYSLEISGGRFHGSITSDDAGFSRSVKLTLSRIDGPALLLFNPCWQLSTTQLLSHFPPGGWERESEG